MRALLALALLAPAALAAAPVATPLDAVCLVHFPLEEVDATEEAADAAPADVMLGMGGDLMGTIAARFGAAQPFSGLRFAVSIPGATVGELYRGDLDWYYWSEHDSWRVMAQREVRFVEPGVEEFTFSPPPDWAPRRVGCSSAPLFVVGYGWGRPHATPPMGDQVLALR